MGLVILSENSVLRRIAVAAEHGWGSDRLIGPFGEVCGRAILA